MQELSDQQFKKIATIAEARWGLHLPDTKRTLVQGRMTKLLRKSDATSMDDLIDRLGDDASDAEILDFFDSLATNTTSFFREKQHFDYLEHQVYPAIAQRADATGKRTIRVWSAACSIGAEPYTLAVHLHEWFGGLDGWDAKILATDLSSKAVTRTKQGVYTENELQGMPKALRATYFERAGERQWRVGSAIRSMVSVHRLNLLDPWPMQGPFDSILLRNVMIYFDAPVREKLVNRMANLLDEHAVLIIGSAETLSGLNTPYKSVQPAVYRPERCHS